MQVKIWDLLLVLSLTTEVTCYMTEGGYENRDLGT